MPRTFPQLVAEVLEKRRRLLPAVVRPEVTAAEIRLRVLRLYFGPDRRS